MNIWDEQWELGSLDMDTGEKVTNNSLIRTKNYIGVIPNKEMRCVAPLGIIICYYDRNYRYLSEYKDTPSVINPSSGSTFTVPSNANYMLFRMPSGYGTTYANDVSINIPSSDTSYHASNKTTALSESLGQTVYGAMWYPRTGKLRVTHQIVDLGDLTYIYNSQYQYFYAEISSMADSGYGLSDRYQLTTASYDGNQPDNTFKMSVTGNKRMFITNRAYNDATTFKTAMVGAKVVYELATPFTIQLTPHEISLLKDYAYVSTNGTTIAFDYHNGELASLADVSQLGETVNDGLNYLQRNNGQSGTAYVDISSYNSATNKYIFPNDGYVYFSSQGVSTGTVEIPLYGANDIQVGRIRKNISATYQDELIFVRKGMKCCVTNKPNNTFTHFYPLV